LRIADWKSGVAAMLLVAGVAVGGQDSGTVHVLVETELGAIEIAVDTTAAPATAANFLRYVDAGHYNGGTFHRTVTMANQPDNAVKIEVIQAGVNPDKAAQGFGPIKIERTSVTGIHHTDGTVSMARAQADSATSGWFICVNDQPSLDFGGARNPDGQGFAAFGRVVHGMDVVRRIHTAPNTREQQLTPPVRILSAKRISG
jgi:peptidyl-prolyl cis-trans isomerase A (cyclophilin A)